MALLHKAGEVCPAQPETIIGYLQASWRLGRESAGLDLAKLYVEGMTGFDPNREKAKEILWKLTLKPSYHSGEADRMLIAMAREDLKAPVAQQHQPPAP